MLNAIKRMIFSDNENILHNKLRDTIAENPPSPEAEQSSIPYENIICGQLLSGATMLETIRDSQLRLCQSLQQEQRTIDELNVHNDEAQQSLRQLEQIISAISTGAHQGEASLSELTQSLKEVSECVAAIQSISNQTNLIAINSAIEAAHVGIAGRGFSVIAKETKTLSHDVQQSAASIIEIIKIIERKTDNVNSTLSAQTPFITQVNKKISSVVASIEIVIRRSVQMQGIIRYVSLLQFLNTVKLDHVIWKFQVYQLLYQQKTDYHLSTCTECRLGKWYYEGEGRTFCHIAAFAALEAPHKAVHVSGKEALDAFFAGDLIKMHAALKTMEEASQRVALLIDQLADSIPPQVQLH